MKKCSREEPHFAPLNEKDVPQNVNLRYAFFHRGILKKMIFFLLLF